MKVQKQFCHKQFAFPKYQHMQKKYLVIHYTAATQKISLMLAIITNLIQGFPQMLGGGSINESINGGTMMRGA